MPETTSSVPGRSGPRRVPSRFFHPLHNAVITVVMIVALAAALWRVVRWAVLDAVLLPAGPQACRVASGACWAFVQDKAQLLLVGLYPREQLWRTGAAGLIAAVVVAMSCMPRFWRPALLPLWLGAAGACWLLLSGGVAGLLPVRSDEWGGLLLTIVLTAGSVLLAFPLGVLLALARRSDITALRVPAMAYVELMRAMPLLAVLFAAAVLVPVLLPADVEVPKVVRAWLGIAACMSAYVAEAVRGGLNAVPKGQLEAAKSIALGYWKAHVLVILPQALRHAAPALTTTVLDFFKGTSLVLIIGLFDLMGAARAALADLEWQAFFVELYLAAALLYFVCSFALSRYAAWLERHLNSAQQAP